MSIRGIALAVSVLALLCTCSLAVAVPSEGEEGTVTVSGTTSDEVRQGSTYVCYVSIDSLKDIISLDLEVRFNPDAVRLSSVNNTVSCKTSDSNQGDDYLRFLYLFDNEDTDSSSNLFYFYYEVLGDAVPGRYYFDIIVNEAYDSDIVSLNVIGSRCSFEITALSITKTCNIYSLSSIATSVGETFELSYHLSTTQISSGSITISYDDTLFAMDSVKLGGFMTSKIVDVRHIVGSSIITFTSSEYGYDNDLLTLGFRALRNVDADSKITMTVSGLCDLDLNDILCNGFITRIIQNYDDTWAGDKPRMWCDSELQDQTLTIDVRLDAESNLGAGDFVLYFDSNVFRYNGYSKTVDFNPDYFIVNESKVSQGQLKFSILSLNGITDATYIMSTSLGIIRSCEDRESEIGVIGSNVSDSMTNPIILNYVKATISVPLEHDFGDWVIESEPTCTENGVRTHACSDCGFVEEESVDMIPHQISDEWFTDGESHWKECSVCHYKKDASLHHASVWTTDGICHWHVCEICGHQYDKDHHSGDKGSDVTCNVCGAVYSSQRTGDFNGDGVVNGLDSLLLKKKIAGWSIDVDEVDLDLNGDGVVNGLDSLLLKKKIAGWNVEFSFY